MLNRTVQSTRDRVADIVLQLLERRAVKKPDQLGDDLRAIGLSSLDMVNLMLAVEAEFDLKIPEAEMTPQNFRSISSIDALVTSLRESGMATSA
jgi:acyl carrier protein